MAKFEFRLSPKFWLAIVGLWILMLLNDTWLHPAWWLAVAFDLTMGTLTLWCYYREVARRRREVTLARE